jgi:hypothetical protein
MKRKALAMILVSVCTISLTACSGKSESPVSESSQQETEAEETEKAVETPEEETEEPADETTGVVHESAFGYSMSYDPSVFELEESDDADRFTYAGEEEVDAPIYISVLPYADMDAESLAAGLVLQSGRDDVTAEDTYFGADGIETKNVYIETEVGDITQVQAMYAIPMGEGSLLVEIGGYVGEPQMAEWKLEEMLGTFTLNDKN